LSSTAGVVSAIVTLGFEGAGVGLVVEFAGAGFWDSVCIVFLDFSVKRLVGHWLSNQGKIIGKCYISDIDVLMYTQKKV
jgi:hypothetical protein